MSLQSLVLCSDERIVRVLRRVLSDLEIGMEHCTQADAAIHRLTRHRFEAVIVDCADSVGASQVLRSARIAPCNKRAVAVAVIDGQTGLRNAFEMGAHFVLYKPISMERAKASFRAARALMKRERRRNSRLPVEIPVTFMMDGVAPLRAVTTDLSEGGMAVQLSKRKDESPMRVHLVLPGTDQVIECGGEVAWANAAGQTGVRFVELSEESRQHLREWLNDHVPEGERDDPPMSCKVTDLSLGGCYLEVLAPFPVRTRVVLSMRMADLKVQAEGVVRVMHPEVGMAVEFTQDTAQQCEHVENFIQALMKSNGIVPDLLVEPCGLEGESSQPRKAAPETAEVEDPLLDLFHSKAGLSPDAFLEELRKQRRSQADPAPNNLSI